MNKLTYTVRFFSDWHCGSGLAAGADVDALVVKDGEGLPFIPGKTIKGLVREQLLLLAQFGRGITEEQVCKLMGYFDNKDEKQQGTAFFSNATLSRQEHQAIVGNKAQEYLFRSIANTAIEKDGIVRDKSLRKMEVVVPCDLHGVILEVDDALVEPLTLALQLVKRIGQGRNRGLGRCQISVGKGGQK